MDINQNTYVSRHFESSLLDPDGVLAARELALSEKIFTKLWEHYPGRDWKVLVNIPGGICSIKLPRLHHSALGFNFPLDMLAADPNMLIVVRAGGELLERFNLTRGRFNKAEMVDRIRARRVFRKDDFAGELARDKHATRERRLIVPAEYANADIEAIRGKGMADAAREIAAAAARPVTAEDLETIEARIRSVTNDNTRKALAA